MSNNLRPHQWQIGGVVFGRGTLYEVLGVKPDSYNVNNQDFQIPLADETRMGQDTLQAGIITFTIGVKDNAPMPYIAGNLPDDLVSKSSKLLGALQKEWKATDERLQWGVLKPITYRDGYGVVKQVYGRPSKFTYTPKTKTSQWHKVTAEYRRSDTLSYTEAEYGAALVLDADPADYTRAAGDADTWFRVVLTGPQSNPLIVVGEVQIQLDYDIPIGVKVEVNSYPWTRRIIDSNGFNLRTILVGNTKYLDQLQIPADTTVSMSWTATETTGDSACEVLWRDAYQVL